MTSPTAAPSTSAGRPNVVAPDRAKKLSKRLLKLAARQSGVLRIGQLADAQNVVAELFGLPGWHALTSLPQTSPASMPSANGSAVRPGTAWSWTTLLQTSGSIALSALFAALEQRLLPLARPILVDGLTVWAVVHKPQGNAPFTVQVGLVTPQDGLDDDNSWMACAAPEIAVWPTLNHAIEQGDQPRPLTTKAVPGIVPVLYPWTLTGTVQQGRVEVHHAAWLNNGDCTRQLLATARLWWSLLLTREPAVSIALRLGSLNGTIHADVAVDAGLSGSESWQRLQDAVDFGRQFPEALPKDRKVTLPQEIWPWPSGPAFQWKDARWTGQKLGFDTGSNLQTTHIQMIAPACESTRTRWLAAGVADRALRTDHSLNGVLLLSQAGLEALGQDPVFKPVRPSLHPMPPTWLHNPFLLPPGARRPDPVHHHLLIAGLQEITGLFDTTNGFLTLLIENAYAAVEAGEFPCVSIKALVQVLKSAPMSSFTNLSTFRGQPLLTVALERLQDVSDLMQEPLHEVPDPGLMVIVPTGTGALDRSMVWFTMALCRVISIAHAGRTDVWAIDTEAFQVEEARARSSTQGVDSNRWHLVLGPLVREARKTGEVVMIARGSALDDSLLEFATLKVQDDPVLDDQGQPLMNLMVFTKEGIRERKVAWDA